MVKSSDLLMDALRTQCKGDEPVEQILKATEELIREGNKPFSASIRREIGLDAKSYRNARRRLERRIERVRSRLSEKSGSSLSDSDS